MTGGKGSADAIIALGSNMGDKAANMRAAIEALCARGDISLLARSRDYRTAPWGKTDQDWFVNACISVSTRLSAHDLLRRCQEVENTLGRVRAEKWGPRIIDVDILWWRGGAVDEPHLKLPHPHIADRAFVLVPLADIAPDLVIGGATVRDLKARIDASEVMELGAK